MNEEENGQRQKNFMVVRYAASYGQVDVMSEHKAVEQRQGRVAFAKIGKPLAKVRIGEINRMVAQGIDPRIFFVSQRSGKRHVFEAIIEEASDRYKPKYGLIMPEYYRMSGVDKLARGWLIIREVREREPFHRNEFVTISTRGDLRHALDRSTAGVFVVQRV